MNYNLFEKAFYAADETYHNGIYDTGEYCHEQSFKWGFQEGVDWLLELNDDQTDRTPYEVKSYLREMFD